MPKHSSAHRLLSAPVRRQRTPAGGCSECIHMKTLVILIILMLTTSCGHVPPMDSEPRISTTSDPGQPASTHTPPPPTIQFSPTAPITSPTPPPPEPIASPTSVLGQRTPTHTPAPPIIVEAAGARFQVEDVAIYSHCLTLAFAVRGFRPPTGLQSHAFLPPARSITVRVITPDGEILAQPLGSDEVNQGNEDEGRIWLRQHAVYSLPREVPSDQEVILEVTVILDQDFQSAQPISYHFSAVSSPGTSSCP